MKQWDRWLDLRSLRDAMGLGQVQLATMLGVSPRTVQSCEQGWRKPSHSLEKQILLLRIAHVQGPELSRTTCWRFTDCPKRLRDACLVYHCRQGHLCWLLTGNTCRGMTVRTWADKKTVCGRCEFFRFLVGP